MTQHCSRARAIRSLKECRQRESQLASSAAQQALLIEQMPAAVAMFDAEMRYLAVSQSFLSLIEVPCSPTEVIGRSYFEIFRDAPPNARAKFARVLAGEELGDTETPLSRRDGRTDLVRWKMKPWRMADQRVGGALVAAELVTKEVEAKRALAKNQAQLRATFENAAVGISHFTPDGRLLECNNAMTRIVGWSANELVNTSFEEITHPEDLAVELAQWEQLRNGKIASYSLDKRYLRKDGTTVWTSRTVSCVRNSDGAIEYLVSVIEDISARKHAEERLHLLMREANHRVKNLLSLVQAIVRQTAPDCFAIFGDRIRALAANQDLLVRNEWRGTGVGDLVRVQLAHLADFFEFRIALRGPKLRLNEAAAQAVGLALHELATNAGKYGALSTDTGRVQVDWRIDGDAFTMTWTERKGPLVRPPEHHGFGTTVTDAMVKQTLGGEVKLDYAPSGLVWCLTCPARNALEQGSPEA
jgi:PAS domain S-box-containing protein